MGREEERRFIGLALFGSESSGVVIAGAAGVGKTRLATEMLAEAAERGHDVEAVIATRSAATVPFGIFAHVLGATDRALSRTELLLRLNTVVNRRADEGTLVVAVDDAHLVDEGTAAFLHALAVQSRVRLLITLRSHEPAPDAITALWKDGRLLRLDLQPLADADVDQLAEEAVGGFLDQATRQRVRRSCAGNPLLLREMLLAASDAGALVGSAGVWGWRGPTVIGDRLSAIISERLGDLGIEERQVLEALSLGEPLPAATLERWGGPQTFELLESRGLVVSDHGSAERVEIRFAHPLYGEIIAAQLSALARRRILVVLAEALLALPEASDDDRFRAAVWQTDAGVGGDVALLMPAARRALAAFEHLLAERLARRALALGGGIEARVVIGHAMYWTDRYAECEAELAAVDADNATDGERAELALIRSSARFWGLDDDAGCLALLDDTTRRITDPTAAAALASQKAMVHVWSGDPVAATAIASDVIESCFADDAARLRAVVPLVLSWAVDGRSEPAVALAAESLGTAMDSSHALPLLPGELLALQSAAHWLGGDLRAAATLAADVTAWCLDNNEEAMQGIFVLLAGQAALSSGDRTGAVRHLREAVALLDRHDPGRTSAWAWAALAAAFAQSGHDDDAMWAAKEARERARNATRLLDPLIDWAEAWADAAQGNVSAAASRLVSAAESLVDRGMRAVELFLLTEATRMGAERSTSKRLIELETQLGTLGASASRALAVGVAKNDALLLATASEAFEHEGALLVAAEAAALCSRAHRGDGRRAPAAESANRARGLLARCTGGTLPLVSIGDDLLVDTLTAREREIAGLAARGLTNRVIADNLVLSERTVENHLARVYGKLGVSSRSELPVALPASESA